MTTEVSRCRRCKTLIHPLLGLKFEIGIYKLISSWAVRHHCSASFASRPNIVQGFAKHIQYKYPRLCFLSSDSYGRVCLALLYTIKLGPFFGSGHQNPAYPCFASCNSHSHAIHKQYFLRWVLFEKGLTCNYVAGPIYSRGITIMLHGHISHWHP